MAMVAAAEGGSVVWWGVGEEAAAACEAAVVGLSDAVKELESEMARIRLLLGAARTRKMSNEQLAPCLRELKQLQLDGEDVLDELSYYRLKQQIEGDSCVPLCNLSSEFHRSDELIHTSTPDLVCVPREESRAITGTIESIVRRSRDITVPVYQALKLDKMDSIAMSYQDQSVISSSRLTGSYLPERKVYGRDTEKDHIIELMTNEMPGGFGLKVFSIVGDGGVGKTTLAQTGLKVFSIVGNGGVGKTTLAQTVCSDPRVRSHFDLQMWICVSDNFDPVRITNEMLDYFPEGGHKGITNFNKLQQMLEENIESKRFLIVLDDVWDISDRWDKLLAPLNYNPAAGSFILVTTRNLSVAQEVGTAGFFCLDALKESDFWLLFKSYACGDEKYHMRRRLYTIGREIAKKLKGYPLEAKTVGALLRKNLTVEHWNRIQRDEEWKSLQDNNGIMAALKLSYDHLPCHLQACFSYCSLFPKDHKFYEEELVKMWISQGFVFNGKPGKRLEEIGSEYLRDLVNFGFLQYEQNRMSCSGTMYEYDGYYVMHDLMHNLACLVSANECVTLDGSGSKEVLPEIHHLSIIWNSYRPDDQILLEKIKKIENQLDRIRSVRKLRTLILIGLCKCYFLRFFQNIFGEAQRLRLVLFKSMHPCHYKSCAELDASICNVLNPSHLRYLKLDSLPSLGSKLQDMSKFYNLEVLGIGDMVDTKKLSNLINLRHLIADEKVHSTIADVGKMTSLQELQSFKVQKAAGFDIGQIRFMNELALLRISQLQNVESKTEARRAVLTDKSHLNVLSLSWDDTNNLKLSVQAADVLEALEPHRNLKHLQITGYMGVMSPSWLAGNLSVTSLQSLHLENCGEWILFPSLHMLSSLKRLKLIKMWKATEVCIPSLEELVLTQMPKLEVCTSFCTTELASSLKLVVIKSCANLRDLTLFWDYHNFNVEHRTWFPSLNELTVMDCPQLTWLFPPMHDCPSEVKEMESFPSLCKLTICDCSNVTVSCPLVNIPYVSIKGSSRALEIYKSDDELELSSDELRMLDDEILAFCSRKYRTIRIRNCPNLASLSFEALNQFTLLSEMMIEDCPNFLPEHDMSEANNEGNAAVKGFVLPCLDCLDIRRCGIAGKWISQMVSHAHSMYGLHLTDCPNMKLLLINYSQEEDGSFSLTSSSQFPDAATTVVPEECVFRVPTGVCSSLRKLHISNCPDLVLGQGHGSFAEFKCLQVLEIRRCPWLVSSMFQQNARSLPSSLEELDIDLLPAEVFLGEDMSSLRTLAIWDSPQLKSLQLHPPCTMVEVHMNNESRWQHHERVEQEKGVHQSLASLQALTFGNCLKLMDLPAGIHVLPCLEDLTIINCPGISRLPENGLPPSLELLWINKCNEKLNEQCRMAATEKLEVDVDGEYVNQLPS